MKKTSEVKVPAKVIKATTRIVEKIYCDICTDEIKSAQRRHKCVLCARDIHGYDYGRSKDKRQCCASDPDDYGDYPSIYCIVCHDLKFKGHYRDIYQELQDNLEREEAILERKIKKESLAWQPNQKQK